MTVVWNLQAYPSQDFLVSTYQMENAIGLTVWCVKNTPKRAPPFVKGNLFYTSCCQVCKQLGSSDGIYVGETGRSLFERAKELLDDAHTEKDSSCIYKHWTLNHPDADTTRVLLHSDKDTQVSS